MNMRISLRLLFVAFVLQTTSASAFEIRNLLQKRADSSKLSEILLKKQQWVSYPSYSNREAWGQLFGVYSANIIKDGNEQLSYAWKAITATQYLEYERSGSRTIMEGPYGANAKALGALVYAELAEGKGRYMDQIINGVWYYCDMPSWVLSAHLPVQKTRRNLPDFNEQIIDLGSGDTGAFLSWVYYFFHNEFDKVNPIISTRLKEMISQRILVPYLQRNDYWWQGFNYKPGDIINNWNPWVNTNVMLSYLLIEDDENKMIAGVYKTMQSVDQFINYVKSDGACEEGPSYWDHAAGKLYDYLEILKRATAGKLNLFDEPLVKKMGEYIANCYVGNGWVVNFADASAKGGGNPRLIYRYGQAVGSSVLSQFAYNLGKSQKAIPDFVATRDFFRTIENYITDTAYLVNQNKVSFSNTHWYPETQMLFSENEKGLFLAAKGGFNNESHNHNDVGTFSIYIKGTPFIVDAGVGTYTRQTFGKERYTIWTMQSQYHNLPLVNGYPQRYGDAYAATKVSYDEKHHLLSMDIANAYDSAAKVKSWIRQVKLTDNAVKVEESFSLSELVGNNELHFLSWPKPVVVELGKILLEKEGKKLTLLYDKNVLSPIIETIPQTDKRLSNVWGEELYRIILKAIKRQSSGTYSYSFIEN